MVEFIVYILAKLIRIPRRIRKYYFLIFNRYKFGINGIIFGHRMKVYNQLFLELRSGSSIIIGNDFTFTSGDSYNPLCRNIKGCIHTQLPSSKIIIGNNVGMSSTCLWAKESIKIGDNVNIGGDCIIFDTDCHNLDYIVRRYCDSRDGDTANSAPVIIEDDVLIGTRCIILKGVTIGARSVIGCGSVVTKDIPSDCIAAGNPCKVIRYLYENNISQMNKPLVTIITVCYNAVNDIEETILSIINQTYKNVEFIIIDGGSTDGTVDIIRKYTDRISYWKSEQDKGIYDAMNKGIAKASGEWINFMNAGDLFHDSNTIENVFKNSIKNNVGVVYGEVLLNDNNYTYPDRTRKIEFMKRGMPFCHQASFTRRTILYGFNTTYKICSDYAFFYNLYKKYGRNIFMFVPIKIAVYNVGGISAIQLKNCRKEWLDIRSKDRNLWWYYDCVKYVIKFIILRMKK